MAEFPSSGTPRPDIRSSARSVTIGAYLVLYRIVDDTVEIVRVLHAIRVLHAMRDLPIAAPDFRGEAPGAWQQGPVVPLASLSRLIAL
ncbi:type II toxin-antitoxin system RelE/ParE family toxin [Sphingomonas sp. RT2P30]